MAMTMTMTIKPARRLGKKLLISLATLVVVLGGLELIARAAGYAPSDQQPRWMAHPELQAILMPNQRTWLGYDNPETGEKRLPLYINRHGQRGPDYPLRKAADELRVIVVGDSLVFGPGVHGEETFPAVLAAHHAERGDGRRPFVVNAGVNGWASWHYMRWAETQIDRFRPDVLVVGLYLGNDMVLPRGVAGTIPVPLENTLRGSAFYRLLVQTYRKHLWKRVAAARRSMYIHDLEADLERYMGLSESQLSPEDQQTLWEKNSIPHMKRIAEVCRAKDVSLAVLVIPTFGMTLPPAEPPAHRFVRQRLEELGIPTVVILEELREGGREAWLPWDAGHFSPEGHRIVAGALARGLDRLGLLP